VKSARSRSKLARNVRSNPARHEAAQASRRAKALEVLLSGGTQTAAAKAAGVSLRTLHRWLEGDVGGLRTELEWERAKILDALGERMRLAAGRGLTTLLDTLTGKKTSREQLAAARALVRLAAGVVAIRPGGDAPAVEVPIAVGQAPPVIIWVDNGRGPPPPGAQKA
jgi:hypothetical protein